MSKEMFYFTFGVGHSFGDRFQPIVAENEEQARVKMFETFGNAWSFGYTQKEFQESLDKGYFKRLKPLKPIYAKEVVQ